MPEDSETSRRQFLITTAAAGAAGLAGCSGDNSENNGDEPTPTDTPENNTPTPGQDPTPTPSASEIDPQLNITGEEVIEYEDSLGIQRGESAVISCGGLEDEDYKTVIQVSAPETEVSGVNCGDSVELNDLGEYGFDLVVVNNSEIIGETESEITTLNPAKIQPGEFPEEILKGEEQNLIYNITGTDVQTTHNIQMPNGEQRQLNGEQLTLQPEQTGQISIETIAQNPVSTDEIQKILEVERDTTVDQQKNLEKRLEALNFVHSAGPLSYHFYDTEVMKKKTEEELWQNVGPQMQFNEPGIHPNLEYHVGGNYRWNPDINASNTLFFVRSYSEIGEEETPADLIGWEWTQGEVEEEYHGREIWGRTHGEGIKWGLDRENGYLIGGSVHEKEDKHGIKYVVDIMDGRKDINSFADNSLWYDNEKYFDEVVVAEGYLDMDTNQFEHEGVMGVQILDENGETVTEKDYAHEGDYGDRRLAVLKEEDGIPIEDVVEAYGNNAKGRN